MSGTVRPPGSKSLTNRALVVGALARPAVSRLYGTLAADDTAAMVGGLRSFGVLVDDNEDPWLVLGTGGDILVPETAVDVGASGTTARFLTALAALAPGTAVIDGTPRMRERPIAPLAAALGDLGVEVATRGGFPPVEVRGAGRLSGGRVKVDSSLSSQFASALLLISPMAEGMVEIELEGPVVSRGYLEGTVEVMRAFGASVTVDGDRFVVEPGGYAKAHYIIEADASAAVYPAVAAAITGGSVTIEGIPPGSSQPDLIILDVLATMGCDVVHDELGIHVTGPGGTLHPVDVDFTGAPDGAMAVAVAALFASGRSRLRGLSTLRVKETDRLTALETELSRLGAEATAGEGTLEIVPGALRGATIETYDDHRMAMSLSLVGLVVPGVSIADPGVVNKTWPGFYDMLEAL